jgi:hypothetical protein
LGQQLESTISIFSTTEVNGLSVHFEVTDGLRVLGAPVGSLKFCQAFLLKALSKAQSDADKLLSNLEDLQTTLRLYSMYTANKIKYLFLHDVYNTTLDELPDQHWLWNSDLTDKFSTMTANLIANIANQSSLPIYSQLIANISIQEGGLGIQSPRTNAITSYMTTTKRCLQYAHQGAWLGLNKPRPILLTPITLLYQQWKSSQNQSWLIFRKYLNIFNNVTVPNLILIMIMCSKPP